MNDGTFFGGGMPRNVLVAYRMRKTSAHIQPIKLDTIVGTHHILMTWVLPLLTPNRQAPQSVIHVSWHHFLSRRFCARGWSRRPRHLRSYLSGHEPSLFKIDLSELVAFE